MWWKKIIWLFFLFIFIWVNSISFAITSPYEKEKQLWIDLYLEADSLVYTPPTWFSPVALDDASEDASYWINYVLPYPEDRNEDLYLVIPQLWLVTPIVQIPSWTYDYNLMKWGGQIDINKYLKWGVIEYAGSTQPWQRGKRIDFGHSNFYKTDDGRYKSIFANLMALDPWDQVRYYVKQEDGTYRLFKYRVYASYNTVPSNTQPMLWDGDGTDALIFWCTHGLDGRWMIEATYMGEPFWKPEDQYEVIEVSPYDDIDIHLRKRIDIAVRKIWWLSDRKKRYLIINLFKKFDMLKKKTHDDMKLLLLDYTEVMLSHVYPE